jgi:hypothetical protein
MLQRRGVLAIAMIVAVAALVAVLATDRRAAAEWDVDCATPTVTYSETNPAPPNLDLTSADVVLFASGTFGGS